MRQQTYDKSCGHSRPPVGSRGSCIFAFLHLLLPASLLPCICSALSGGVWVFDLAPSLARPARNSKSQFRFSSAVPNFSQLLDLSLAFDFLHIFFDSFVFLSFSWPPVDLKHPHPGATSNPVFVSFSVPSNSTSLFWRACMNPLLERSPCRACNIIYQIRGTPTPRTSVREYHLTT